MQTIPQAFESFLQSLELTPTQTTNASRQHTNLRTELQNRLSVADNFLSGSYARNTAVRPLNDIDIFFVLDKTHAGLEPSALLRLIAKELERIYPGKTSTRQPRSVNIEFTGTGIAYDVVPAFLVEPEIYRIPDSEARGWIKTNPRVHKELSTAANKRSGNKLKPLLKAVKHAKNVHEGQARSFHLEVLSWSILDSNPGPYIDGLVRLLAGLSRQVCAPCPDPAQLGPDIRPSMDRCRSAQRGLEQMAALAKAARQLAGVGRVDEAHSKLRKLLGPAWPERGTGR